MNSAVPDVLASDLDVIFCGINPGRVSAAAAAHFANPRNDFWRLLHEAGFTPRLVEQIRGRIQSLADAQLDAAGGRGGMDLIRDYALPIPTTIIAEIIRIPIRIG